MRFFLLLLTFVFTGVRLVVAADEGDLAAAFKAAQRIVFLGDSITYGGDYVDQFEIFFRLNYSRPRLELLDLGLPSETVSGLSEDGHAGGKFPRPTLHERLDRVLEQTKPDVVLACYGMNDGIYQPYDETRARKFQEGIRLLHEKVRARGAVIVHLTPPVFDPLPLAGKTSADGLGPPFQDYDDVLARYSAWLVEQRTQAGWHVIDVHSRMAAALRSGREAQRDFKFAGDGVHPNHEGHLVIGAALIEGLKIDRLPDYHRAAYSKDADLLALVKKRRKLLSDAWLAACGHQRPGMTRGLPLAEAQAQAAVLEKQIDAAMQFEATSPGQ